MVYEHINQLLARYEVDVAAAEIHGVAAGMLCMDECINAEQWLHEIFQRPESLTVADRKVLNALFTQTANGLASDDFLFDLLLPDDNTLVRERAEALCNWAQSFLVGLGYARPQTSWPGDSAEIVKDIVEITKLDSDIADDTTEEDEQAVFEIAEYLKAAVLLLRHELRSHES